MPEDHLILILAQWHDTSFIDTEFSIGYHFREVYLIDNTQTFAVGAGALGRVEGEIVGSWIAIADTCCGAHQALGEMLDGARVLIEDQDQSLALFHGYADRLA